MNSKSDDKLPNNKKEMANFLKERLLSIFQKSEIDFAVLGGSWAKGTNKWWSDIDIFLSIPTFQKFNAKKRLHFLADLRVKASELTQIEKIEISVLETLPLHVQFDAIKHSIKLYLKNKEVYPQFLERLLPRYYDHIIWYENMLKKRDLKEE